MFLQKCLYLSFDEFKGVRLCSSPFICEFNNGVISFKEHGYLTVRESELTLSAEESIWDHNDEKLLKHINSMLWICCDLDYNLYLSTDEKEAIPLSFLNNSLAYIKPNLRYNFDNINVSKNIHRSLISSKNEGLKIGILLAGGLSTRFKDSCGDVASVKQLFKIKNKSVIEYSIDILENIMDFVFVVTNSSIKEDISKLVSNRPNFKIIINDVNCRLKSIETAIVYIRENYGSVSSLIIHDSARPFITVTHIEVLINSYNSGCMYSQYYLKLVNGLIKKDPYNFETVDRDDFIEICTPICVDFELFYYLFMNYIANPEERIVWDLIPLLDLMKIKYNLIESHIKYLRKITTIEDIF